MIKFDLLRQVYEIMYKVPDKKVNMSYIKKELECGTVGCALGWAASDKKFCETNGISLKQKASDIFDSAINLNGSAYFPGDYPEVGMSLFGITFHQAENLFSSRGNSVYDKSIIKNRPTIGDRKLFLYRMRKFFEEQGLKLE